ncbi:hypothetical protein [Sulfuricurvum sp.]|uniref:hypothetical protein n=1 Tax=Sulfuricurvum sp. TaxID=2025608 RepID=UPI00286DB196|nr:hypothetical protein [Sulfuricurvum sp.]
MKNLLIALMIILFVNLIWTVVSIETAPFYWLGNILNADTNSTLATTIIDKWAIRGQIGDIMSGHFSALAFLAVALSIIYQSEANQQMRVSIDKQEESLEQQSIALGVQSKSLEAQIEELKESREESSKQTEEFFINNMNTKLDRYYKLLEQQVDNVLDKRDYINLASVVTKKMNGQFVSDEEYQQINNSIILSKNVHDILEIIYQEIHLISEESNAFKQFDREFKLRIEVDHKISSLCAIGDKDQYVFLNAYGYPCYALKYRELS